MTEILAVYPRGAAPINTALYGESLLRQWYYSTPQHLPGSIALCCVLFGDTSFFHISTQGLGLFSADCHCLFPLVSFTIITHNRTKKTLWTLLGGILELVQI